MSNEMTYRARLELVTSDDINEFCELCKTVKDHDIYIKGFDEFGRPWVMNAKSMLGTLALTTAMERRNQEKAEKRGIVDWNTIYVESTYPKLYTLVEKFAR